MGHQKLGRERAYTYQGRLQTRILWRLRWG